MEAVVVEYPDERTRRWAEAKAHKIRSLVRRGVMVAVEMGQELEEVKGRLQHGFWLTWLDANFGWTEETARKYRRLAAAVEQNPRILEFQSLEAACRFPQLPPRVQEEVMERGAFRWAAGASR